MLRRVRYTHTRSREGRKETPSVTRHTHLRPRPRSGAQTDVSKADSFIGRNGITTATVVEGVSSPTVASLGEVSIGPQFFMSKKKIDKKCTKGVRNLRVFEFVKGREYLGKGG